MPPLPMVGDLLLYLWTKFSRDDLSTEKLMRRNSNMWLTIVIECMLVPENIFAPDMEFCINLTQALIGNLPASNF